MAIRFRPMERADIAAFHTLLATYNREFLNLDSCPDPDVLSRDGLGTEFRVILAHDEGPIGFAAWIDHYDLHHGMPGGDVIDMYVTPQYRGRGIAAQLVAETAAAIQAHGGQYIKGQFLAGEAPTARLYRRVSHQIEGTECYVSGRAFRALTGLKGLSARAILKSLPPVDWNWLP